MENIKDRLSHGWIQCIMMFEIVGRPPAHISEALKLLLKGLGKEKDVLIIRKSLHKPKKSDKAKNLYSTFAEVDIALNGIKRLSEIVFDYMPSSIDVIEPSKIEIETMEANSFINDLSTKLHRHELMSKLLALERDKLKKEVDDLRKRLGIQI